MKFHGVEIDPRPGETPTRARERVLKEQHEALQQAIVSGEHPLHANVPASGSGFKVVGLDYTPTMRG